MDCFVLGRNAHFIRVINGRSLDEEYTPETVNAQELSRSQLIPTLKNQLLTLWICVADMHLEDPDSDAVFYILLRATEKFYGEFLRYSLFCNCLKNWTNMFGFC